MSGFSYLLRPIELLIKPKQAVQKIIEEKLGFKRGLVYAAVYGFLFGFLTLMEIGFSMGGVSSLTNLQWILYSVGLMVLYLWITIAIFGIVSSLMFRLASKILKGKGTFGSEVGVLGLVGSSYIFVFLIAFFLLGVASLILSLFLEPTSLQRNSWFWIAQGMVALIIFPFLFSLFTSSIELISETEDIDIYKSSLICGFIIGSTMFDIFTLILLITYASWGSINNVTEILSVLFGIALYFTVLVMGFPTICLITTAIIRFIGEKTKKDAYFGSKLVGLFFGLIVLIGCVLIAVFIPFLGMSD